MLLSLFMYIIVQFSAVMFEGTKPLLDDSIHIYHWSSFSGAIAEALSFEANHCTN